ncbi:MAG: RBBP9/YdeN family alpha/beta hydrolase [Leptothrix sp. (in: b-proteobacteria)]
MTADHPATPRWTAPRLLIVPGLRDSGPTHWQTWLQARQRQALRIEQTDWQTPDLTRWAGQIAQSLEALRGAPCLVAAHSFGCLALARHLALRPDLPVAAALLVAPADPDKFGVATMLPQSALPMPTTLVASDTDPWMHADQARGWAQRWGCAFVNLGDAGHINAEAGFGPLPLAQRWVTAASQRLAREWRRSDSPSFMRLSDKQAPFASFSGRSALPSIRSIPSS